MGLTADEVKGVKDSWSIMWKDKSCSDEFFIQLFTQFPGAQDKFKDFKGLTPEQVKNHEKLPVHSQKVFAAINNLVENLENPSKLVELIKTTGKAHVSRGVGEVEVKWVANPLVETMKKKIGTVTELQKSGWTKVVDVIAGNWQ